MPSATPHSRLVPSAEALAREKNARKRWNPQAMSFLKSLPPDAGLLEIFRAFPESAWPLLQYQEALLRGESPFTAAERELIAACVSGLNNCDYCRAVHSHTAVAL